MEIMDGVGTDRWEVGMATEEKQRRKPEERNMETRSNLACETSN